LKSIFGGSGSGSGSGDCLGGLSYRWDANFSQCWQTYTPPGQCDHKVETLVGNKKCGH